MTGEPITTTLLALVGKVITGRAVDAALRQVVTRARSQLSAQGLGEAQEAVGRAIAAARQELRDEYFSKGGELADDVLAFLDRPAFAKEVAQLLLVRGRPNFDALREHYFGQTEDAEALTERWNRMKDPLESFIVSLEDHLKADPQFGPLLRDTQKLVRQGGAEVQNQIAETSERVAVAVEAGVDLQVEHSLRLGEIVGWLEGIGEALGEAPALAVRGEVQVEPPRYHAIEVFYVTDRKPTGSGRPRKFYGAGRSGDLSYGTCVVTLPTDRRLGELPGPSLWRLEWRTDPKKHVVLEAIKPVERREFFTALRGRLGLAGEPEALVFIHGFNVTFENAARRAAQIVYDLQFPGAPVLYSWPSHGQGTLLGYTRDGSNAEWSAPHLERFLEELGVESGARRIHVIAHSMGNRVLVEALHRVAARLGGAGPQFHEVLLTAPDIDAEVFRTLAAEMLPVAQRVTLYASSKDRALLLSKTLNGFPRAGDAGDHIVVVPPMESIDASEVDTNLVGHFYYGENRSVLSDVFYLLREGLPAGERFGHEKRQGRWGTYWALRP